MTNPAEPRPPSRLGLAQQDSLREVPLRELLSDVTDRVRLLATRELDLARAELQSDIHSQIGVARGLGLAAVCALLGLSMLLVAVVLGLATIMPGWAAALLVGAPLLVSGVVMGKAAWARRLKTPLEVTRASLKEDFAWVKDRLA